MRTKIATQLVLKNPQVVSFEGRLIHTDTSKSLNEKLEKVIMQTKDSENSPVSDKLNLVFQFRQKSQKISRLEENELIIPRDSILRMKNNRIADPIIEAMINHPDTMQYVTAIDACSDEINCRPEVFAPCVQKDKASSSGAYRRQPYNSSCHAHYIIMPVKKRYERCVNDSETCGFEDCFLHQFQEMIKVKLFDKVFKGSV